MSELIFGENRRNSNNSSPAESAQRVLLKGRDNDVVILYLISVKIKLDASRESFHVNRQKCRVLFSLKTKQNTFQNVVCCSCNWRLNLG